MKLFKQATQKSLEVFPLEYTTRQLLYNEIFGNYCASMKKAHFKVKPTNFDLKCQVLFSIKTIESYQSLMKSICFTKSGKHMVVLPTSLIIQLFNLLLEN